MNFRDGITIIQTRICDGVTPHHELMARGLRAHGLTPEISVSKTPTTKTVICWGWRKGEQFVRRGHRVLLMERGYLGDRFYWTSLAWGGLNGYGDFRLPTTCDPARFLDNFAMLPWNPTGDYVLIMGQVPGDMSLHGTNIHAWCIEAARFYKARGDAVMIRPHPLARKRGWWPIRGVPEAHGGLDEALAGARLVVTFNSNSGVDAILAGKPTVVVDPGGMAYPVAAGHAFGGETTDDPGREDWAARLAWCQWSPRELEDGTAWERMKL